MSLFIVHLSPIEISPEAELRLAKALYDAGYSMTIVGRNQSEYRLPRFVYHKRSNETKDLVLAQVKRIALWSTKQCAIIVMDCAEVVWVGLDSIDVRTPASFSRSELLATAHRDSEKSDYSGTSNTTLLVASAD